MHTQKTLVFALAVCTFGFAARADEWMSWKEQSEAATGWTRGNGSPSAIGVPGERVLVNINERYSGDPFNKPTLEDRSSSNSSSVPLVITRGTPQFRLQPQTSGGVIGQTASTSWTKSDSQPQPTNSGVESSTFSTKSLAGRIVGVAPVFTPGGISLSKAAAERMALNLDVDSAYYRNGVLFLSGKKSKESVDASLFLTAMRLACDSGGDPYFSLDPPDPASWDEQSELILKSAARQIKSTRKGGYSFDSFPFSSQKYPALKSELVFRPDWLRDTRFGEIMYKADVLLKEISVGQSVVNPGQSFRGKRVPDYVSTLRRSLDMDAPDRAEGSDTARNVRGFRLWFDLTTTGDRSNEAASSVIFTNAGVLDLSAIQPRMYVRRHEGGEDLPGSDPANDQVANDLNARTALYAESFDELRELTGAFRAYVAALKVANDNSTVCSTIQGLALSPGEKIQAPLPAYRDAIVHRAVKRTTSGRIIYTRTNMMVSGGIGMRGRRLYETGAIEKETQISTTLRQEVERGVSQPAWERDGRQYVALDIDPREPPPRVPITALH